MLRIVWKWGFHSSGVRGKAKCEIWGPRPFHLVQERLGRDNDSEGLGGNPINAIIWQGGYDLCEKSDNQNIRAVSLNESKWDYSVTDIFDFNIYHYVMKDI